MKDDESKSLLVKILIIDADESRDKIIKATNFQTAIPPASLKATEKIQRDIEDHFKTNDLFYDRRKNFYKNSGKPANKIISIPLLAQSINTVIRKEPHVSRARPASLLKKMDVYNELFSDAIKPEIFLLCAQIVKKVESRLKEATIGFTIQEKRNLKFQILMGIVIKLLNNKDYKAEDLDGLVINMINDALIDTTIKEIINLTRTYMNEKKQSLEVSSKSKDLTAYIINNLQISKLKKKI